MKATQFKSLLAGLASLTPSQRKKLAEALSPTAWPMSCRLLRESVCKT